MDNNIDLSDLSDLKKVVGINQTKKAVTGGNAKKVFAALDADEQFLLQIRKLCESGQVEIEESMTMSELGAACGIDVGCAVCALVE